MSIFDVDKHIESFDDSLKYVAPWEYLKSVADPDWQTGKPGLHMQTSFVQYEEYERDWMKNMKEIGWRRMVWSICLSK